MKEIEERIAKISKNIKRKDFRNKTSKSIFNQKQLDPVLTFKQSIPSKETFEAPKMADNDIFERSESSRNG